MALSGVLRMNVTAELLAPLHDTPTGHRLAAERAFLAALDGSCETPIAGLAADRRATRSGCAAKILRPDGSQKLATEGRALLADGAALGRELAAELRGRAPAGFFDWM